MDKYAQRRVPGWLNYGLSYFIVTLVTLTISGSDIAISTVWMAGGIAMAGVLRHGPRLLPMIFLANALALWLIGTPWALLLPASLGAVAAIFIGYLLLKNHHFSFQEPKTVIQFILLAALLPSNISAIIGSYSLWHLEVIETGSLITSLASWWLGDACGILITAPLILCWRTPISSPRQQGKLREVLLLYLFNGFVCTAIFSGVFPPSAQQYPLTYLTVIPLAWSVLKFHPRVVTVLMATTATIALIGTSYGYGPFVQADNQSLSVLLLQLYTITLCVGSFVIKSMLLEQDKTQGRLSLAEKIVEHSPDGLVITDAMGSILSANPAFYRSTGVKPEEIVGQPLSTLDSGHQGEHFHQKMLQALEQEGEWQGEIWTRTKKGDVHPEWVNIIAIKNGSTTNHYLGIYSDIAQQKQISERMHRLAYYDNLTQLPNRELFHDRLEQATRYAARSKSLVGLLFLDLDRFKHINDTLGHTIGDLLLAEAAKRLRECIRKVDSLARFGGDEFTLILQDIHEDFDAILVAEKILRAFKTPFALEHHKLYLTTSIGISIYPEHGNSVDDLIKHADTAMYRAKAAGGNSYQIFETQMSEPFLWNLKVETALRRAIEKRQIQLLYQPQFDLQTGAVVGLEALARWNDSNLGTIPPDTFIQIAENTGLIHQLGEQILLMASQQSLKWGNEGIQGLRIAVNVSAMQLKQPEFIILAKEAMELQNTSSNRLELEITETSMMENAEFMEEILHRLAKLNLRIAIDDFGTGYSSLSYLKQLPISLLKIDKSFITDLPENSNDAAICRAIIAMAQSLNLRVLAEGVETEAQMRFLHQENCSEMQGYLHSKPISAKEISEMIRLGYWHIGSTVSEQSVPLRK